MKRISLIAMLLLVLPALAAKEAPIELVLDSYIPDWSSNPGTQCVNRFFKDNPNVSVRPFSNLKLPGSLGSADTAKLMAFAGGIGPDLVQARFHQLESYN